MAKEYIERAEAKEELLSWARCIKHPEHLLTEDAMCVLDNIPAADVVEVVHGRWELHGDDDDIGCSYFCSKCGYNMDEDEYLDNWSHFKYCPNCGARMDGEK